MAAQEKTRGWAIRSDEAELNSRKGERAVHEIANVTRSRGNEGDDIAAISRETAGNLQFEEKCAHLRRWAFHGAHEIIDIDRRRTEQSQQSAASVLRGFLRPAIAASGARGRGRFLLRAPQYGRWYFWLRLLAKKFEFVPQFFLAWRRRLALGKEILRPPTKQRRQRAFDILDARAKRRPFAQEIVGAFRARVER